jgi:mannose-6-phosphate isomerase
MVKIQESKLFGASGARALALRGVVQGYAWGKVGAASRIASVLKSYGQEQPLAEYWIGSHPKAPSMLLMEDGAHVSLTDALRVDATVVLGEEVAQRYDNELPFLLKVLSINPDHGLSIQAHPDEQRAQVLHARDPSKYPDPRHKPEVALPLSRVKLLYGLRPVAEILDVLERFPELCKLLDDGVRNDLREVNAADVRAQGDVVKRLYSVLLTSAAADISEVVGALKQRGMASDTESEELALVERLSRQYGDADVGLVALFIMNLVTVEPGQALFIGPNIPHAYLDGDLVECMACSDNVVRAGLTQKYRDVQTLLEMLDCTPRRPSIIEPHMRDDGFYVVDTPAEEFHVAFLAEGSERSRIVSGRGVTVVISLGREVVLTNAGTGQRLVLTDGGAALIPPESGEYLLERSHAAVFMVST